MLGFRRNELSDDHLGYQNGYRPCLLTNHDAGLIQSLSQGLLPELSAWVEVGGIASSLCSRAFLLQPISI